MKDDFFKFPSTPHLATLPGVDIRGDKVLSELECNEFLKHDLVVEEKVDGANLGISFDLKGNIRTQNRGAYLHIPGFGQWKNLKAWLAPRTDILFENLNDRFILFGEWCYAQHSVFYDRLPDWFLGFDIYDKVSGHFLSSSRRDSLCKKMCIAQVPVIARGRFIFPELVKLLSHSRLTYQPAEGLYLRFDQEEWLAQRAKLVRSAFIQSVEQHWSRSAIKPNRLCLEVQR
jgi:hypothetical protein